MAQRSRTRSAKKKLKIIPLGGLHEIGKNLTVIDDSGEADDQQGGGEGGGSTDPNE